MSRDQSSIASTVTGGIQEISALLPLLGTEQCEEHTGSALGKGYFYTCVTSVSIFGSLGIVKAGFNVLVAAIVFSRWNFLGAQHLADGGFRPKGDVAQLIALDPQKSGRFLAESHLEKILEDEHIENVEDLKIDWAPDSFLWNIKMALSTFGVSALGITPYLFIILRSRTTDKNPLFLSGWGFPIARLVGSSLAGILIQIIIQIRILVIIKNRLIFIATDRYIRTASNLDQRHINELNNLLQSTGWSANRMSEMCLWDLRGFLRQKRGPVVKTPSKNSASDVENEAGHCDKPFDFSALNNYFKQTRRRHFPELGNLSLLSLANLEEILRSPIYIFLHILLATSMLLSVGGYIGSFNLVQNADQDFGPVLWLILEILLCLFRIVVWAWNPTSDDNKGVAFTISLASNSPLVTCNIYGEDLENSVVDSAPIVRSQTFLEEIASYTGPLPAFQWNDAQLYYILTGSKYRDDKPENRARKVLYIVVSAFKEQTSRLLIKRPDSEDFLFFVSELKPDPHSTIITIDTRLGSHIGPNFGSTRPETHVLTSHPDFMKQLSDHYNMILKRINNVNHALEQTFSSSWALQRIEPLENKSDTVPVQFPNLDSDVLTQPPNLVTDADFEYLKQGRLETRRNLYAKCLEIWIDEYLGIFERELLEQVPYSADGPMMKYEGIETNEVEHLIAEARRHMEMLLLDTFKSWRTVIVTNHKSMANRVVSSFRPSSPENSTLKVNSTGKLSERLRSEINHRLKRFSTLDSERMQRRIDTHSESVRARIEKRKYLDPKEGKRIIKKWRDNLGLKDAWDSYQKTSSFEATEDAPDFTSSKFTVDSLADEHDQARTRRLKEKDRFLVGSEGKKLLDRCLLRFQRWNAKLQLNAKEFEEIASQEFLSEPSSADEISKYWNDAAVKQRLTLVDHRIKYLVVSDGLVKNLGGFPNLARALRQSQISILYFKGAFGDSSANGSTVERLGENGHDSDYRDKAPQENSNELPAHTLLDSIRAIAASAPSITGIHFSNKIYGVSDSIQDVIKSNIANILARPGTQMICQYDNIEIKNYYGISRPYASILFGQSSRCAVKFRVDEEVDHTLSLTHAFATLEAEIDIKLNGQALGNRKGSRHRTLNEFYNEQFFISKDRLRTRRNDNTLVIKLVHHSHIDPSQQDATAADHSQSNAVTVQADRSLADKNPGDYLLADVVILEHKSTILQGPAETAYTPMTTFYAEPEGIDVEATHQQKNTVSFA